MMGGRVPKMRNLMVWHKCQSENHCYVSEIDHIKSVSQQSVTFKLNDNTTQNKYGPGMADYFEVIDSIKVNTGALSLFHH